MSTGSCAVLCLMLRSPNRGSCVLPAKLCHFAVEGIEVVLPGHHDPVTAWTCKKCSISLELRLRGAPQLRVFNPHCVSQQRLLSPWNMAPSATRAPDGTAVLHLGLSVECKNTSPLIFKSLMLK